MKNFFGNPQVAATLDGMLESRRIPQTILLAGPEGIGKATLARRFAATLLPDSFLVERDDLSLPENLQILADREKWPADKRSADPLLFSSHPDFVTFPPDGPLRQINIQQMRLLKERAQYKPLKGSYRVFLIDGLDRANEQAANSLLKTLEEPPSHVLLFATAQNPYDLLPTIRSRSVLLYMSPLPPEEMERFASFRKLPDVKCRLALANGSPGIAVRLDLEAYRKRRDAMLSLLAAASGHTNFSSWSRVAESVASSRSEKLDGYLEALYLLLEDLVLIQHGHEAIRNADIREALEPIATKVGFPWLVRAVAAVDDMVEYARRNVQKSIALDALVASLRSAS